MSKKTVVSLVCGAVFGLAASVAGAADITVTTTVRVTSGTFDGHNNRYIAKGLGDGGQGENQKPVFRVENGATLRNVRVGAPGADGIHTYNGANLANIVWEDVGEDAMTVKSSGNVTLNGGSASKATDKVLQVNAATTFTISNFTATTFGTFLRQNGGTGFTITVRATNVTLNSGSNGFRTDSSSSQFYHRNVRFNSVTTPWRVPNQSAQVHAF